MSVDFNYGFGNASALLEKVRRDEDRLYKAIISQDSNSISDSLFNFAVTAYHIKDWLKNESIGGVERHINSDPMLRLCADLCNGSKHKILNSAREVDDPAQSINNSELTCDMTSITADSTIPINGHTLRIELASGKQVEILDFASKVLNSWEVFFKEQKL